MSTRTYLLRGFKPAVDLQIAADLMLTCNTKQLASDLVFLPLTPTDRWMTWMNGGTDCWDLFEYVYEALTVIYIIVTRSLALLCHAVATGTVKVRTPHSSVEEVRGHARSKL